MPLISEFEMDEQKARNARIEAEMTHQYGELKMQIASAGTSILNEVKNVHLGTDQVIEHINNEIDKLSKFLEVGNLELNQLEEHREQLIQALKMVDHRQGCLRRSLSAVNGDNVPQAAPKNISGGIFATEKSPNYTPGGMGIGAQYGA